MRAERPHVRFAGRVAPIAPTSFAFDAATALKIAWRLSWSRVLMISSFHLSASSCSTCTYSFSCETSAGIVESTSSRKARKHSSIALGAAGSCAPPAFSWLPVRTARGALCAAALPWRSLLSSLSSVSARKAAARRALLQWHSDKFHARFGDRVTQGGDGERVAAKITETTRFLQGLLQSLGDGA